MAIKAPNAFRKHCVLLLLVTTILASILIILYRPYGIREKILSAGGAKKPDEQFHEKKVDAENPDEYFDMKRVDSKKPDEQLDMKTVSEKHELSINFVIVPYLHYEKASESQVLERQGEYREALQRNLNHRFIERVHVLTTNATDTRRLLKVEALSNYSKLVVVELNSIHYMRGPFEYISQNLVGKDAMFANGDTYLGDGFHLVDPHVMAKGKTMYCLTRHESQESREKCRAPNKCLDEPYIGSHDGFLFRLTEPLPEKALHELEFHLSSWGMENVLMWVFHDMLKFCLLNPCRTLQLYHLHCSNLRSGGRQRVNNHGKSRTSPFTNALVCGI